MVHFCKAGFALAAAAVITGVHSFSEDRHFQALAYRGLDGSDDDYSDLYSRDLLDDDYLEDEYLSVRSIDDADIDSLLAQFSRRQQPQQQQPPPIPAMRNTPQDIAALCTKPIPTAQDFTSFFSRSGLPSDRTLFWSGIKDSSAMKIGQSLGRVTLEMFVKPNNTPLPGCEKGQNGPNSQLWWNAASEGFGNWADGQVAVVFSQKRYDEIRTGKSLSTWVRVEAPALWRKIKSAASKVVGGVTNAMNNAIARIKQGFLTQAANGQVQAPAPAPATPAPAAPAQANGQPGGNGLETVLMYICDANGENLNAPRAYDGPVPVSGNAAGVQKPARRRR